MNFWVVKRRSVMTTKKADKVQKRKVLGFCPICGVGIEMDSSFKEHFFLGHGKEAPSPYIDENKTSITLNSLGLYCPKCGRLIGRTVKAYKRHFLGVHKRRLIINKKGLLADPVLKRYPRKEVFFQGGAPGLGKRK